MFITSTGVTGVCMTMLLFAGARDLNSGPLVKKCDNGRSYRDKVWSCDKRMDHLETAISRDPSHNEPPSDDTIAYTSKHWLI